MSFALGSRITIAEPCLAYRSSNVVLVISISLSICSKQTPPSSVAELNRNSQSSIFEPSCSMIYPMNMLAQLFELLLKNSDEIIVKEKYVSP